jgi:hypothetical protein
MTGTGDGPELLFVYNADSGLWNGALDTLHKIVSPSTYACRLCEVSYGLLGMKRAWADTIRSLTVPARFLHRDEFEQAFPGAGTALPAILVLRASGLEPLVSARDFETVETLPDLQRLLATRLAEAGLA